MSRKTFVQIDLAAVSANFEKLKSLAPTSEAIAVVKADAYGNGAIEVARALELQVSMFAVAIIEEAIELRDAGIKAPILILQGPFEASELTDTTSLNLHWMLHNPLQLDWFEHVNDDLGLDGHQWIKMDSGMHRLGFQPDQWQVLNEQYPKTFTENAVIATHLARADEHDSGFSDEQLSRFLTQLTASNNPLSIANSAAVIDIKKAHSHFNRIGIAAYGASPFKQDAKIVLDNVMTFYAPIIAIRTIDSGESVGYGGTFTAKQPTTIATIAAGYADGYPRHAPTGTKAALEGNMITLAGRVSMDMLTFDISNIPDAKIGDMVELWGPTININDVASQVGTIGYELMTRISKRVTRKYTR